MNKTRPSKLLSPQQALGNYLDEMLHRATLSAKTVTKPPSKPPAPNPPAQVAPTPAIEPAVGPIAETVPATPARADTAATSIEFPLQCLMFRVGGHLLSVPLIQLSSVVHWNDGLTRLPESPPWMLGLIQHRDRKLRVVDSQQLLDIDGTSNGQPEHLLVLEDGDWAITCDHLEQVVNLECDDIQWRRGDSQLTLGTIRESLSTLLNPPGVAASLNARING